MNTIKLFENKKVRSHWDEAEELWYLSVGSTSSPTCGDFDNLIILK
jgi:hypothetical protein